MSEGRGWRGRLVSGLVGLLVGASLVWAFTRNRPSMQLPVAQERAMLAAALPYPGTQFLLQHEGDTGIEGARLWHMYGDDGQHPLVRVQTLRG